MNVNTVCIYFVKLKKVGLPEKRDVQLFWDRGSIYIYCNMASYSEQYRQRVLANTFCKSASVVDSSKIVA